MLSAERVSSRCCCRLAAIAWKLHSGCLIYSTKTKTAVCALNDQGFHFRVHPPMLVTSDVGDKTSEDVEALMICFETSMGNVYMNVALRHNKRRMSDHARVGA